MSNMSDRLLATLNAVTARDQVSAETTKSEPFRPGLDFDTDTGEWKGEDPDGYSPAPLPPSLEDIASKESKVPDFANSDATTDYQRVRDTTYAMQEATMFMMGQAAKLAATTEAPRAFSVFRELGELMRGLNKDLMENQKTLKAVTVDEDPPDTTVDVTTTADGTTTVSVGKTARSSRDLLRTIEEARKRADARTSGKTTDKSDIVDVDVEEVEPEPVEKEQNVEEARDGSATS